MTIALGSLLLLFAIAFGFIVLFRKTSPFKNPGLIVLVVIFAGFGLLLSDRITEFTIPNVGTLKAATKQATADAETIGKLKERVENQSATVDLVAGQAAKAQQLSETAVAQTKQVDDRLDKINAVITDATATLEKLKQEEEFVGLVVAAQSDDRGSYDRLRKIADEQDNPFAKLAGQAWLTIYEAHSSPMSQGGFQVPWKEGIDPAKLSFDDLKSSYDASSAPIRPGLLEYVWGRKDIPTIDRMDFMIEVMKKDHSLTASEYAGRYFAQGAGLQVKAMALDYFDDWWGKHRQEFVDKK
jgi:hypothetical protein